jgi:hypothetical protein
MYLSQPASSCEKGVEEEKLVWETVVEILFEIRLLNLF